MGKKRKTAPLDGNDRPDGNDHDDDALTPASSAETAKRHLEEALKRKQQGLASRHGPGNAPQFKTHGGFTGGNPGKGRQFRHQGR